LRRGRRAVRWVRKPAQMRAQDVEVVLHFAVVQRVQAAQVQQIVHRHTRLVRARGTECAQNHLCTGITSFRPGVASFEQRQVRRRIDIALASFTREVFLVPQLVHLDLARLYRHNLFNLTGQSIVDPHCSVISSTGGTTEQLYKLPTG